METIAALLTSSRKETIHGFWSVVSPAIAKQHTAVCSLAGGNHNRHGRGQTECARTGNDQHRHGVDQTKHPSLLRAKQTLGKKRRYGDGYHYDHKMAGNGVGHALHWCFGTLRVGHHLHNLRKHGF